MEDTSPTQPGGNNLTCSQNATKESCRFLTIPGSGNFHTTFFFRMQKPRNECYQLENQNECLFNVHIENYISKEHNPVNDLLSVS